MPRMSLPRLFVISLTFIALSVIAAGALWVSGSSVFAAKDAATGTKLGRRFV